MGTQTRKLKLMNLKQTIEVSVPATDVIVWSVFGFPVAG